MSDDHAAAHTLDAKGRCCGRKPIHYKGGSWRSPPGCPMWFCCTCHREYSDPSGVQQANWAWDGNGKRRFGA